MLDSQYKIILYVLYAFCYVYNKRIIIPICINCELFIYIYITYTYIHKVYMYIYKYRYRQIER